MNRLKKDYIKILDWLDFLNEDKIVPGLERIKELMHHLGNPQEKLEIVMIGGTNAKGSTCFSLNSSLNSAGIKSGCFTSPHLHSIRERIRIGEKIISIEEALSSNQVSNKSLFTFSIYFFPSILASLSSLLNSSTSIRSSIPFNIS